MGSAIDVVFDHVLLPCEKKDASLSYKQKFGYFPGVLMSGEMILGIVMCEGNNPFDDFGEDKCLRLVVQRVEKHVEHSPDERECRLPAGYRHPEELLGRVHCPIIDVKIIIISDKRGKKTKKQLFLELFFAFWREIRKKIVSLHRL